MIKIKLGIADSDRLYLERFTDFLEKKYRNEIGIYTFSDPDSVPQAVKENRINVLLASQDMSIDEEKLSDFCMFAWLSDSRIIDTYNGHRTICRYQRAELIYRQILGLYSEKLADKVRYRISDGKKAEISLFLSAADGSGSVTAAAAFAEYLSAKGNKTLFLNLRQFHSTENIFSAPGEGTFTDVIFALKSRKVNMTLKLESVVRQSEKGVYFFEQCRNPLDYTEINNQELLELMGEISTGSGYDRIVAVCDFFFTDRLELLMQYASDIIIVSGDSSVCRQMLERKYEAVRYLEKRNRINITDRIHLLFNRTKYVKTFHSDIPVLGIEPEISASDEKELVSIFSSSGIFDRIYEKEAVI